MPRTKVPKKNKNNSNTSLTSTSLTFNTESQIYKGIASEKEKAFTELESQKIKFLRTFDSQIKLSEIRTKNLNNYTVDSLIQLFKNEGNTELNMAVVEDIQTALLNPTMDFSTLPSLAGSSAGSKSTCSAMSALSSCASNSMRPPSSASSSSKGSRREQNIGSSRRSRSVVKSAPRAPDSGMKRRRSLSQPGSLKKLPLQSAAFKTPFITPKVNPMSSSTLLRFAKDGENVFSLSGSPVLANGLCSSSNKKVHTLIPLRDGRTLAILPNKGLVDGERVAISPNTRRDLIQLKENLDHLVG